MSALLEVENIAKTYRYRTGFFKHSKIQAVRPLSFRLEAGKTIAFMGLNGSGKSTLAKIIAGVENQSQGLIKVNGEPLVNNDFNTRCKLIRMIFQDPNTALNPRLRIGAILEWPLKRNTNMTPLARERRVEKILKRVGLNREIANAYAGMLAAGQKQRVCLARALMLQPSIIVADEAFNDIDVSMRAQMVNLLLELQEEMGLAYVLVSQHLGLVKHVSDELLVMNEGAVVEQGPTLKIFANPQQELTKKLIQNHFSTPSREIFRQRTMHTPEIKI